MVAIAKERYRGIIITMRDAIVVIIIIIIIIIITTTTTTTLGAS
jgi:hypothetical protein